MDWVAELVMETATPHSFAAPNRKRQSAAIAGVILALLLGAIAGWLGATHHHRNTSAVVTVQAVKMTGQRQICVSDTLGANDNRCGVAYAAPGVAIDTTLIGKKMRVTELGNNTVAGQSGGKLPIFLVQPVPAG